jgi:hypothetical protein
VAPPATVKTEIKIWSVVSSTCVCTPFHATSTKQRLVLGASCRSRRQSIHTSQGTECEKCVKGDAVERVVDGISSRQDYLLRHGEDESTEEARYPRGDDPRSKYLGYTTPTPVDFRYSYRGSSGSYNPPNNRMCGCAYGFSKNKTWPGLVLSWRQTYWKPEARSGLLWSKIARNQ